MANSISFKFLASSNPFLSLVSTKLTKNKSFLTQIKCVNKPYEARIKSELETFSKKLEKPKTREESVLIYETWEKTKTANFEDDEITPEEILDMRRGERIKYLRGKFYPTEEEKEKVGNRKKNNVKKPKKLVKPKKGKVEKNRDRKEEDSLATETETLTLAHVEITETTVSGEDGDQDGDVDPENAYVETTGQDGGDD